VKKEVAGQPVWLWAVGAVVIVGGYLYFTHKASSASSASSPGSGTGQGGKSSNTSMFKEWLVQHQGGPKPKPKPKPVNPGGPIRRKRRH
jgi:hypothetical protein